MDYDKLIKDLCWLATYCGQPYSCLILGYILDNAVDAIETLCADLARATAERNAAIADLYYTGGCPTCKLNRGKSDRTGIPICTKKFEYPTGECYEWRGKKED